jgi:hypothetical protein
MQRPRRGGHESGAARDSGPGAWVPAAHATTSNTRPPHQHALHSSARPPRQLRARTRARLQMPSSAQNAMPSICPCYYTHPVPCAEPRSLVHHTIARNSLAGHSFVRYLSVRRSSVHVTCQPSRGRSYVATRAAQRAAQADPPIAAENTGPNPYSTRLTSLL